MPCRFLRERIWRAGEVEQWLKAAREGSHILVAQLLEETPELITVVDDTFRRTALHWATYYGRLEVVELLLKANVGLTNAIDAYDMTALHLAVSGHVSALAVPLLLAANPASLYVIAGGLTPLDRAILSNNAAITAQFFAADPSLVRRTGGFPGVTYVLESEGMTVLHMAAEHECVAIVEQLLAMDPQLAKAVDSQGRTAFDIAVKNYSWEMMIPFVVEDPSLSVKLPVFFQDPALHLVAQRGYAEEVAKLLARHPNMIDEVDSQGKTALHWAATFGHSEIVTQLLAVASPRMINAVAKNRDTALHCAARSNKHFEIVERLLDVMSPEAISAADWEGKTVLYYAACYGEDYIVSRLLTMSPGLIDKVTSKGGTVLHAGAQYEPIVEMLLALRPEMIHVVDNEGNTILHSAISCYATPELIERLMALIPSAVHAVNSRGRTPFENAVHHKALAKAMLVKLSFDEAVSEFTKDKTENYEEEFLLPVLAWQCECLRDVLHRDVVGVVYEYLGLDCRTRHPK